MTGKEILHKMKEKVLGPSDSDSGKGKSKMKKHITHGFHLVKGRSGHAMEDYVVAQFKQVDNNELGLFAIFDGHSGQSVPDYLKTHLFDNILKEPKFWTEPADAVKSAYSITDSTILDKSGELGRGGSTAVTAILINCQKLVVANIGDSRAVLCQNGQAKQLSVDHEPSVESEDIKNRGGFVSNFPGDVPRVDGQLAVSRAFGDKSLKVHLSSEPHVIVELIGDDAEFVILASDGLWKVMTNQEAVDAIRDVKDARSAAKILTEEALNRKSSDDISCVVVKFQ
ncbi:probable protein phosphatase 2C 39 isoform X2 [Vigna radiata var. radiata]|uniref:protein-serine/threonine phosphatase n=1 Tax=Vigna radiata var. radiata TaxID=3916 RepID=A0A1S3TLB8_VIGRR|nr:probable protein phosphatase 2C 39 isoform X2 [Vigna radiata var. radiata]